MDPLQTTSEVIDALGGTAAAAKLTGRSMQAVSNWRSRGFFTAAAYEPISQALAEIGRAADPSVWKSLPPSALISPTLNSERAKPLRCISPHGSAGLATEGQSR